jgi:hypothetical protein
MRVVMSGPSGGLENNNVSDVESDAGTGFENIFEAGMSCFHEGAKQGGITIKPYMQEIRHCQHYMSICYSGQQPSSDEVSPSVGIDFGTGKAKAGLAGESDTSYFSTVAASVLHKAHFVWVAAIKHFLYGVVIVGTVKSCMGLLKRIPVFTENLLECVFVDAFHGCSLRTTIPELTR